MFQSILRRGRVAAVGFALAAAGAAQSAPALDLESAPLATVLGPCGPDQVMVRTNWYSPLITFLVQPPMRSLCLEVLTSQPLGVGDQVRLVRRRGNLAVVWRESPPSASGQETGNGTAEGTGAAPPVRDGDGRR